MSRVSTLADLLAEHTRLPGAAVDHLQRVVAEWQLLADLSFADFLLWVPVPEPRTTSEQVFLCVAHARPTTGPTAHPEDIVGTQVSAAEHPQLRARLREARICREEDPVWHLGLPVRREAIPVVFDQRVIGVLSRDTNLAVPRVPSSLEIAYLGSAADLCQMIADGTFPSDEPVARRAHLPARRRRPDPARRGGRRRVRQPERAVRVPPDGPRGRPGRRTPRRR